MSERFQFPEITEEEKTPVVLKLISFSEKLLEIIEDQNIIIQQLKDEIARLKGNPVSPKLKPSKTIELDKAANKKRSAKSKKKKEKRAEAAGRNPKYN